MEFAEINFLDIEEKQEYVDIIKMVLEECFIEEKMNSSNLYISVTLTNGENIRNINKKYRNIDKETDVLSFPIFEKEEIEEKIINNDNQVKDILGDIIISIPRVEEQAQEYGHTFKRELAYMVVHGFYHLMGYDHIDEEDKIKMRPKEEKILENLKIGR